MESPYLPWRNTKEEIVLIAEHKTVTVTEVNDIQTLVYIAKDREDKCDHKHPLLDNSQRRRKIFEIARKNLLQ